MHNHKIKKNKSTDQIKLNRSTDILAWLGKHKQDHQVLIGFAMETQLIELRDATSEA